VSEQLNYWTPSGPAPSRVLPASSGAGAAGAEPVDWLTMSLVVVIAAAGAFCIVIAMAWVLGA
jgi:hypothetical protein